MFYDGRYDGGINVIMQLYEICIQCVSIIFTHFLRAGFHTESGEKGPVSICPTVVHY